jgi:hypothetical protein
MGVGQCPSSLLVGVVCVCSLQSRVFRISNNVVDELFCDLQWRLLL